MSEYSFLLKIRRDSALNSTDSGATGGKAITDVNITIIYGADKRPTNFLVKWSENGVEMPEININNF